jgi:succinate dehydrogenase / fumarate reductase, cytochrome b subunit
MSTPLKERTFESDTTLKLPKPFVLRRLHSLLGLWLVIYLCFHLLVNAQAAFFLQDDGHGFVSAVNRLESLPFLRTVEVVILALPFLIHGVWGILYAWRGKLNAHRTDGSTPSLPQYKRNRAYSWQRITSWLLVVGIIAHVIHMRFWIYPTHVDHGPQHSYMVRVAYDKGLPLVAEKLDVQLYEKSEIEQKKEALSQEEAHLAQLEKEQGKIPGKFQFHDPYAHLLDEVLNARAWIKAAEKRPLKQGEVLGVSPNAGGAFYLLVRDTFKSPWLVILYSLLVIAAAYHAFNGLWTLLITWGVTLTRRSQKRMRTLSNVLMGIVTLLGLLAAWGTYWTIQLTG